MNGVIYARLSDVRKGDTDGIDRQVREGRAHADRLGIDVDEVLIDNDLTAAKKKRRPDFDRLMAGIAANAWDVVILRSLDRWVRRPAELEQIIEVVEKSKVKVEAVHGTIDLRSRQGRMVARMMTTVAMSEVEATTERVKDWHADRASRGLSQPGRIGFGYRRVEGVVTVEPDEAQMIRDGARRLLEGESVRSVARAWERRPEFVRKVLLAPRTAGLRGHNGKTTEGAWEPILDRVTWERVRAVLTHPDRRTSMSSTPYLLTGLASCHKCRHTLNSRPTAKARRYVCRNCHGVLVYAERLEEHVVLNLFRQADVPALADEVAGRTAEDVAEIAAQILSLEADLEALAVALGDGSLSMAEHKIARAGISDRLATLRRQVSVPDARPWQGEGAELTDRWDGFSAEQQRAVVRAWIGDIEIGPAVRGVNRFDSSRVTIHWR